MTNVRELPHGSDGFLYSRAAVDDETVSDEDRSVEVIASTEDIDRHGTILRANWRLDNFRANPVVFFAHNSRSLPIGTASDIRVEDKQLKARITFSSEELNPEAERVWKNVKAKTIRGVSVGFWPHTVRFEKQNDQEVLVFDDNELLELSMAPVPSNPSALAQMRTRALEAHRSTEPPAPTPPAPSPAPTESTPEPPEKTHMSNDTKNNDATPSVARALGLPAGSSESDIVAAAGRCRELELQIMAITACATSNEALGAVRGLKAKADDVDKLSAENVQLKAERDEQKFDGLIARGTAACQLLPPEVEHYRGLFTQAKQNGRGSDIVGQLEGYLKVAPRKLPQRQAPPAAESKGAADGQGLTWNGKTYAQLKFAERGRLAKEDPDLWTAMKADFDATQNAH